MEFKEPWLLKLFRFAVKNMVSYPNSRNCKHQNLSIF